MAFLFGLFQLTYDIIKRTTWPTDPEKQESRNYHPAYLPRSPQPQCMYCLLAKQFMDEVIC
jgi:hypothetical protein